mgnify:CR=1 FL=1
MLRRNYIRLLRTAPARDAWGTLVSSGLSRAKTAEVGTVASTIYLPAVFPFGSSPEQPDVICPGFARQSGEGLCFAALATTGAFDGYPRGL